MASPQRSTMYNLGSFVRHLVRGFTQDVGPRPTVVRHEVQEQVREGEGGARVTLRRTTIEEIEVSPARGEGAGPAEGGPAGPK